MNRDRQVLMIFGIGKLGGSVVDVLAANYPDHKYVLVSRSASRAALRANLTRYICSQWGRYPEVSYAECDLLNVEATASVLDQYHPDIVLNATTPFPWWAMDAFPDPVRSLTYSAGLGMWCALDCILPLRLCDALSEVSGKPLLVNACYPDMVNAFLREHRAPPALGIGNMSNLIPGLTLTFAEILGVAPSEVTVRLIAHHFVSLNAPSIGGCGGAAYYLSVEHGAEELTFADPDDTPFRELKTRYSRVRGLEGQGVTVNSAATVLGSLLTRVGRRHHTPGPAGLVGGYPVMTTDTGDVELDLPKGVSPERAVSINETAQRYDGLAFVKPGAVALTESTRAALKDITGLELPTVTPDNVADVASDVLSRLNQRYGFGLRL